MKVFILWFLGSMLLFYSCSFLIKEPVLLNDHSKNWERTTTCQKVQSASRITKYNYKYATSTNDSLSLSVGPCLYGYIITWGPPLIPIFLSPKLFTSPNWKKYPFFADLLFQKFNGKVVDLNSIDFIFNQNCKQQADSVYLLSYSIMRVEGEIGLQKITDNTFLIEHDMTRIRFYFNVQRNNVHKLSIDFSRLKVNNNIVSFPIINYVKKSRFLYDPCFIDL